VSFSGGAGSGSERYRRTDKNASKDLSIYFGYPPLICYLLLPNAGVGHNLE